MDMKWHKEKHLDEENVSRHPADSEAWKEFDKIMSGFHKNLVILDLVLQRVVLAHSVTLAHHIACGLSFLLLIIYLLGNVLRTHL